MNKLLAGKVAVVTGAGRGIGAAIARNLAQHGAKIVLTDIDETSIGMLEKELIQADHEVSSVAFDVADFKKIKEKIDEINNVYGRIDIWVNNAGITESSPIESITEQQWDRMQDIDLKSVFFCSQAVYSIMKEQKYGRLIHISSLAGERGGRGSSASYSAAKAGVINLAKSFALNGGEYNITSNAVCPGRTLTEMAKQLSWLTDPKDDPKLTIPLGRFGTPEDIANAVLFLASDLSSYITGATIDVNGGLYMR